MKRLLLAVTLLCAFSTLHAQSINPATQITWPRVTAAGAPSGSCTSTNYGQPYTDTTSNQQYVCSTSGWVHLAVSGVPTTTTLTGDTTGTGAGTIATTTSKINGTTVPASAPCLGTNGSAQPISVPCVTPGGPNGAIQYNNAGALGGSSGATLDGSGNEVVASGTFNNATASSLAGFDGSKKLSTITTLPNGTTATTQSVTDVSDKVATMAAVHAAFGAITPTPISSLACAAQNTDLNLGGGTSDTACINAALASATPAHPVVLLQDKRSLIDGDGIQGPRGGGWGIIGLGSGLKTVKITSCTISSGVATFITNSQDLAAGQGVLLWKFSGCGSLNNTVGTVSATGLSSTGFQVSTAAADHATVAESNAVGQSLYGTGFYFASGSTGNTISNSVTPTATNCELGGGTPPARGTLYELSNFAINGNAQGNPTPYCFGVELQDAAFINLDKLTIFNTRRYGILLSNAANFMIDHARLVIPSATGGNNGDGVHVDGNSFDGMIANSYFDTNDDAIAFNAREGYCGPLKRMVVVNSIVNGSLTAMRLYNSNQDVCTNGLIPVIDTVDVDNYSGNVGSPSVIFLAGGAPHGTLNPAINNIHWNNSTIEVSNFPWGGGTCPIRIQDNIGNLSLSNFTLVSPLFSSMFCLEATTGTQAIGALNLNNVRVNDTTLGSAFRTLFSAPTIPTSIGNLNINGFGVSFYGGSFTGVTCLLCSTSSNLAIATTTVNNLDYSHMDHFTSRATTAAGFVALIYGGYRDDVGYGDGQYYTKFTTDPTVDPGRWFMALNSTAYTLGFRQANSINNGIDVLDSTLTGALEFWNAAHTRKLFAVKDETGNVGEILVNNCPIGTNSRIFCGNSGATITGDASGGWNAVNLTASTSLKLTSGGTAMTGNLGTGTSVVHSALTSATANDVAVFSTSGIADSGILSTSLLVNPMTLLGDIIYGGASGVPTRLAGNTTAQRNCLTQNGTGTVSAIPSWISNCGFPDVNNNYTTAQTFSGNGGAFLPGIYVSGSWSAGTNGPQLYIRQPGAPYFSGSSGGTALAIDATSGFAGNYVDFQLNGVSKFSVSAAGVLATTRVASVLSSQQNLAFSATPAFDATSRSSLIVLTGNITSWTIPAGSDGQEKTLTFCEDVTGGWTTAAAPVNVRGFFTPGTTASKCSSQHFTYSFGLTTWLADSTGVINE